MKKSLYLIIAVLCAALWFTSNIASAIEPIPQESGFSGFVRPGIGYLEYKSNMVASFLGFNLSNETINSLTDSPDSQGNPIAFIPFSLEYTFASTRTQLILGTDLTDLVRFDFSQQFGVKQEIGSLGILQGGILFSGIPAKVWEDPYVVNLKRQDTDRDSIGARLTWDRIAGSGLRLQYTYRNVDIEDEKSGQFLGLPADQRQLLDRDGNLHRGEILYRFNIAEKHRLSPAFKFIREDKDGGAMENDAYEFQLTYGYLGDPFTFTGNVFWGWADYDDRNPIYKKTQDDDSYGIQGALYYKNPWGWNLFGSSPMNFYLEASYSRTNANIDFYDQEAIIATFGVFLKW
jgi:hypothetical protein